MARQSLNNIRGILMSNDTSAASPRPWYLRLGPGLITACVVIGPGSILTASAIGAKYGYSMSWVVAFAVIFMMVYTAMGARIGAVAKKPMGDLLRDKAGSWLAILIGCSVFFIASAFQFGNNLGVHSAFQQYFDFDYTIVIFNAISITFIFAAKDLYKIVEKLMMAFVSLMLLSFAVNLVFAKPDVIGVVKGLIPSGSAIADDDLTLIGLIGTTFVVAAAYYQSYLVRQKGWGVNEVKDGLIDARVGALIMAVITLTIMTTSAAVFFKPAVDGVAPEVVEFSSVGDVAKQLEPLFGKGSDMGKHLFCIGLFCAAYSSFIVNSMIGGFILSDGLNLGNKPTDKWPKIFTALVLLTGMCVALFVIHLMKEDPSYKPIGLIVAAQAVTVVAAPLIAGTLLWISCRRDIMGDQQSGPVSKIIAGVGLVMLVIMSIRLTTEKIYPKLQELMFDPKPVAAEVQSDDTKLNVPKFWFIAEVGAHDEPWACS
jgi:NRAMP (natural resistance-associated macrophage protein)-like metal ion transporter